MKNKSYYHLLGPIICLMLVSIMKSLYIKGGQRYFVHNQLIQFVILPVISFVSFSKIARLIPNLKRNSVIKKIILLILILSLGTSIYCIVFFPDNAYMQKGMGIDLLSRIRFLIKYKLTDKPALISLVYSMLGIVYGLFSD